MSRLSLRIHIKGMFQGLQNANATILQCGTWGAIHQGPALSCILPLVVDLGGPHHPHPPAATPGHHQAVPCSDPGRQVSASTEGCSAAPGQVFSTQCSLGFCNSFARHYR